MAAAGVWLHTPCGGEVVDQVQASSAGTEFGGRSYVGPAVALVGDGAGHQAVPGMEDERDVGGSVADRVGDQFGEDEGIVVIYVAYAPIGQCFAYGGPDISDGLGLKGDADALCRSRAGAPVRGV